MKVILIKQNLFIFFLPQVLFDRVYTLSSMPAHCYIWLVDNVLNCQLDCRVSRNLLAKRSLMLLLILLVYFNYKMGHFAAIGLCLYAIGSLLLTLRASQALIAISHCKG